MAACLSPTLPRQIIHRRRGWTPRPPSSSTATHHQRRHRQHQIIGTSSTAISARASPAAAVALGLDADDIRHPLDKQNTLLLKAIPGLNDIGKALLGPVSEQVMVLQNIGSSVLVSENQLPELHQLMIEAAKILNTEAPDFYIRQNPAPNAYTLAINGKRPFVVVHTSLVELLTRKELQAVLAHELGHLKCDHGVWLTFANILTMGAYTVPGLGMVAGFLEEQLFRWLRAAELTCDRAALLVVQDPKSEPDTPAFTLLSRGCHLSSDEARGRMPIPVGPAERGRLPGASPLVRQGFIEPGRVVHPECSDERAVAPFARDASPRDGRVVAEPGVQDPIAKNVSVASQSVYEMK